MRHAKRWVPSRVSFFFSRKCYLSYFSVQAGRGNHSAQVVLCVMLSKRGKGSVGGGEAGKRAKTTPDAGGKCVSEKSQDTCTCSNPFEKSESKQTEFFVREVKDKRMTKNGPEFLIGWRDFPLERDDTWEPISNLTGSEHMICQFQKQHELDYASKTAAVLKQVADMRKAMNEKNAARHLTIQLTTFRRHETTMDVTMLKKRTTTRTRSMGRVAQLRA